MECDISLWLAKVRSLSATWGSQAEHSTAVQAAAGALAPNQHQNE